MELKPIASAPRDGTEFVAYRVRDNQFVCACLVCWYDEEELIGEFDETYTLDYFTHWHDRPNRPE